MRGWLRWSVLGAVVIGGCSRTVGTSDGQEVGDDGGAYPDGARVDVPFGFDITTGPDAPLPTMDVPTTLVDAPAYDVPPRPDVPIPYDAPTPIDVGLGSIEGTYRLVGYDTPDGDGGVLHVTDTNVPITSGDVTYDIRGNGMLFLTSTRISEALGFLLNDHFYVSDTSMDAASSFSAYGFAAPGTLAGTTFSIFTMSLMFERNADGTIVQVDTTAGTRVTWAPTSVSPGVTSIAIEGEAQLWHSTMSAPFVAPRVALAWDRPGFSTGASFDNDAPIAFGPFNAANYTIRVASPPPDAVGAIGGTLVGLGYPIVYDDTNRNGRFDPGVDSLRGVGSVAVGWRSGVASTLFARSGLREMEEGLQMVDVHADYGTGRLGVTPYDGTSPTPPDVAVDIGPTPTAIPDIVR